jgi:two-component system NtrC family response regulator
LNAARISPTVASYFAGYRWPGHVRKLENVIERMLVLWVTDEIGVDDPPDEIPKVVLKGDWLLLDLPEEGISLEGIERELLVRTLERHGGAVRYLDISRRTLIYRMDALVAPRRRY